MIQQRIMDDTKARRRLERWARNTIVAYLAAVFLLVIMNGASRIIWNDVFTDHGFVNVSFRALSERRDNSNFAA